jgi:hypothetical protein
VALNYVTLNYSTSGQTALPGSLTYSSNADSHTPGSIWVGLS